MEINNYNAMTEIISGLNSIPVNRLRLTWGVKYFYWSLNFFFRYIIETNSLILLFFFLGSKQKMSPVLSRNVRINGTWKKLCKI